MERQEYEEALFDLQKKIAALEDDKTALKRTWAILGQPTPRVAAPVKPVLRKEKKKGLRAAARQFLTHWSEFDSSDWRAALLAQGFNADSVATECNKLKNKGVIEKIRDYNRQTGECARYKRVEANSEKGGK